MKLLLILLTTLFADANAQYAEGNYAEAATQYEQILQEQPTPEVYYNLGNAYFKQGELAQSILAYERALRLKPSFKDAKHNLQFAQSRIIDNIEDTQSFFLSNWLKAIRNALSQRVWMVGSIVLFIMALVGFFLFAFSQTLWLRKTAFYCSVIALVVSVMACANAGSLYQRDTQRSEAIITQGIVNAKSSPDRSGNDLFTVHEGTKVEIHEVIGDWCCVHVGNNIGWMPLEYLERI
ncbi:MAG: tetratricopeptide repeat protein [Paludibacteraceae bacterium]|nr:tetratricopeptide repeat protein [Paludibacteraceae bacterium]MBP3574978.1 tetratricopeptide repeat protein [Paludibacteraceae bacterium]